MKKNIAVVLEHRDGEIRKPSLEALAEALRLKAENGGEVSAILLGSDLDACAAQAAAAGPDHLLCVADEALGAFSTEGHARAAVQALKTVDPGVVLIASSIRGRDLGPAIAALLDAAYAAECIRVEMVDGKLQAVRPVYGGKALATVSSRVETFVIGLRPNVFPADLPQAASAPDIQKLAAELAAGVIASGVSGVEASAQGTLDVAEAEIVVAGGRGVGSAEGFAVLEALADSLGAAIGASRAVVDLGWRPHAEQVGQTGKVVSPKLYFACGISGAIQHIAGMRTSGTIVAINKDAEAPIFKVADYGIVGDLHEVVPALTAALA